MNVLSFSYICFILFAGIGAYVFGFNRFTRAVVRQADSLISTQRQAFVQSLITPYWIGALGWVGTVGTFASLFFIGRASSWSNSVYLFLFDIFLCSVLPFRFLIEHYRSIALQALSGYELRTLDSATGMPLYFSLISLESFY